MASESNGSLNIHALTWMMLFISVAIGLAVYYFTKEIMPTISAPILLFGIYELLSSVLRTKERNMFGTSEAGASIFWGFVITTIGGAGFAWYFSHSFIVVAIFIVLMGAAYMALRVFSSR